MLELTFENGLHIDWIGGLDGGGSTQYKDFLNYLGQYPRHYSHCLEWCAGLGAIGYSILDAGICEKISFNDLYRPAQTFILANAIANDITDKVKFHFGDSVKVIPTDQKFDLVVGNPPHVPMNYEDSMKQNETNRRLIVDVGWQAHVNFFENIVPYLMPGADVILSEISFFEKHVQLAETAGLKFVRHVPAYELSLNSDANAVLMHYRYEA